MLTAHTQLRLARPLATGLRRPWERPAPAQRPTSARVRRGFRHLNPQPSCPTNAPEPSRPSPGRPAGRADTHPTPTSDGLKIKLDHHRTVAR